MIHDWPDDSLYEVLVDFIYEVCGHNYGDTYEDSLDAFQFLVEQEVRRFLRVSGAPFELHDPTHPSYIWLKEGMFYALDQSTDMLTLFLPIQVSRWLVTQSRNSSK